MGRIACERGELGSGEMAASRGPPPILKMRRRWWSSRAVGRRVGGRKGKARGLEFPVKMLYVCCLLGHHWLRYIWVMYMFL